MLLVNIMALGKPRKIRLGDLLVEQQVISAEQLKAALEAQNKTGHKLGRVLIDNNFLTEEQLLNFLAKQLNIEYIDLRRYEVKTEVVRLIPEVQARRFRLIVLDSNPADALIGMADPTDIFAYDEVSRLMAKPLRLAVVKEGDLLKTIDTVYRRTAELSGLTAELELQVSAGEPIRKTSSSSEELADAPVVKLLNTLLEDAIQVNASDIHIEPDEFELRIRFRQDGVMRVQAIAEARITSALISRLKLMAGLDISEKRLPQDGRFNIRVRDKSIDVRLSTIPLQYGESAVLRLLNQSTGIAGLDNLGMPADLLERFRHLVHSPHGLVAVTGPTGSGKTTTLYSALKELNSPDVKIITVEDPIEYRMQGINQVQVNPKIDLTFSRILRTILRQDPDIVLIGEMRDAETVEIGLRTAMTGHLVLSTLHTNDAISTALRLIDMGAEPFLIAASLRCIMGQRLLRRVCENCAEPDTLSPIRKRVLETECGSKLDDVVFKKGRGCTYCNDSGYNGRLGVYELLEMTPELAVLLQNNQLSQFAAAAAVQPGYKNLKKSATELAVAGHTTVDEVMRTAFGMEA